MRHHPIVVAALLALTPLVSAQDLERVATPVLLYGHGITRTGLSWGAGGVPIPGDPNIASAAPALVDDARLFAAAYLAGRGGFTDRNDLAWYGHVAIPDAVLAGGSTGRLSAAFGYRRIHDERFTATLVVATPEDPGGPGQRLKIEENRRIHQGFGALAWREAWWRIGAAGGLNRFVVSGELGEREVSEGANGWMLAASGEIDPIESLTLGGVVQLVGDIKYAAPMTGPRAETAIRRPVALPGRVDLYLRYAPLPTVQVLAMGRQWRWADAPDARLENVWQLHLGLTTTVWRAATVAVGFFTLNEATAERRADLGEPDLNGTRDQRFLTAAVTVSLPHGLAVTVQIMDSHLFDNERFREVYGSEEGMLQQTTGSQGVAWRR